MILKSCNEFEDCTTFCSTVKAEKRTSVSYEFDRKTANVTEKTIGDVFMHVF